MLQKSLIGLPHFSVLKLLVRSICSCLFEGRSVVLLRKLKRLVILFSWALQEKYNSYSHFSIFYNTTTVKSFSLVNELLLVGTKIINFCLGYNGYVNIIFNFFYQTGKFISKWVFLKVRLSVSVLYSKISQLINKIGLFCFISQAFSLRVPSIRLLNLLWKKIVLRLRENYVENKYLCYYYFSMQLFLFQCHSLPKLCYQVRHNVLK